jgi:hypothetical protein
VRTAYQPLFRVQVRHAYYAGGRADGDFFLEPSAATRQLATQSVVLKMLPDGGAAYVEVMPGTSPAALARPLQAADLQFTFLLHARNAQLESVTDLPPYRPSRTVFVFDNLRDDTAGVVMHLGDSVHGRRVGPSIDLVSGPTLFYTLVAPAAEAVLTLRDRFGATRWAGTVVLSDSVHLTDAVRLDLSAIGGIGPGRYTVSDDGGGSAEFYYDPELNGRRPLAIVDIFASTSGLTPDGSERVPSAYRFLSGDRIAAATDYTIAFEPRATTWRYEVVKKYEANGIELAALTVDGPVAFTRDVDGSRAVFTSTAAVRLSQVRRHLVLAHQGSPIRSLPNPGVGTPLGQGAAAGQFVSGFVVNV